MAVSIYGVGGGGVFYGVENPILNPYGNMEYSISGNPIPYGKGNFSLVLLGVPYNDSFTDTVLVTEGNSVYIAGMGTYQDLLDIWRACLVGAGYGASVHVDFFDVRAIGSQNITGKMKFPQLLGYYGGTALVNIRLDFYAMEFYEVITIPGPYIDGDPLPPPAAGLTYPWGNGSYGAGFWNRGQGV